MGRPKSSINKTERQRLAANDERDLVRAVVVEALRQHPNGITAPLLAAKIGVSPMTARIHLEHLVATGEAYRHDVGARTAAYYPNHRLAHPVSEEPLEAGGRFYTIQVVRNLLGETVVVQEKMRDPRGEWKTIGAIGVSEEGLTRLAERLHEVAKGLRMVRVKEGSR